MTQSATLDPDSLSDSATTPASGSRIPPLDWDGTELPEDVSKHPLMQLDAFGIPQAWIELRDRGRLPLEASELVSSYQARAEFLVGAWVINEIVPRRIIAGGLLGNLQPQMLRTADTLGAGGPLDPEEPQPGEGRFLNAILEPRRSAKTTSIWCVLIGRCWMRAVYMAAYTMLTTAQKAAERFKLDVRDPIIRKWRNPKDCPVKLNGSNGALGVEFPNGSKLSILSPNGDAVRSGAYDVLVMDEAGEAEPEMWDDIVGAVVPSFDTRPGSQMVYAGTGGKYREGSHFWDVLHDLDAGRLRYGVPDDVDERRLESWEAGAGELAEQLHPGLDGLTNLSTIRRNFGILKALKFGREYLGHFGKDSGNANLLSATEWEASRLEGEPPSGVKPLALAFAVHYGGAWASVAVGWLVPDDRPADLVQTALVEAGEAEPAPPLAAVKLVHHQAGNAKLARTLFDLWKQLRIPIVYDDAPQERAVIQELQRLARQARVRIPTDMVRFAEKAVATTKLLNGITHRTVIHWEQSELDDAAGIAVPRISGKARLIGAPDDESDVTPLDASALVLLRMPDEEPEESFDPIVVG